MKDTLTRAAELIETALDRPALLRDRSWEARVTIDRLHEMVATDIRTDSSAAIVARDARLLRAAAAVIEAATYAVRVADDITGPLQTALAAYEAACRE